MMSTDALIGRIMGTAGGSAAERIRYELQYAHAYDAVNGGKYDSLINDAAERLCARIDSDGCITNEAAEECENALLPMKDAAKSLTIHFTGHAHIDMNWMWGYNETAAVALDTFRTVLKLMDTYPLFTFSQSQTSTYQIVETFDPVLFGKIAEKIREGRWEVSASTWVEADKNMTDAESMVRHLLYTRKYMKEKFGLNEDDVQVDFEPDTFGHSRFVPGILAQSGVKYYYHMRGNIPEDGRDLHYWKSPDGRRVLMHREPEGYGSAIDYGFLARVPGDCARNGIHHRLKPYGVGDHGGGPTRRDIERILEMMRWPIAPTVKFSTYRDYFGAVEAENVDFPIIDSEVNYVFTGCYSSQCAIKGSNRRSERALFAAEAANAIAGVYAGAKPYDYEKAWTNTLFNQFHDIVTGSGVSDTRNFALGRYQETMGFAYGGRSRALNELSDAIDTTCFGDITDRSAYVDGGGVGFRGTAQWSSAFGADADIHPVAAGGTKRLFTVFNPTVIDRNEVVRITLWDFDGDDNTLQAKDAKGNVLPIELLDRNYWWNHNYRNILVRLSVPAMGYTTVSVEHGGAPIPGPRVTRDRIEAYPEWKLENALIRASFNEKMELVSLIDKRTGEEKMTAPGYFALVWQNPYIDPGSGMAGNAWSESFPTAERNLNETCPVFLTAKPQGSLRPAFGYRIVLNQTEIRVTVSLDEGSDRLDYEIGTEWRELFDDKKGIPTLHFRVPTDGEGKRFVSKVPGGYLERKPEQHDVPAIGCAAVAGEKSALALMTDATYGFRYKDGMLSTTLLRNSNGPDNCPEIGFRQWKLALALTDGTNVALDREETLFSNSLFMAANVVHPGTLPLEGGLFTVSSGASVSAVKNAENGNGIVIRLFNLLSSENSVRVSLTKAPASVTLVSPTEKDVEALPFDEKGFERKFLPGELLSFRVTF